MQLVNANECIMICFAVVLYLLVVCRVREPIAKLRSIVGLKNVTYSAYGLSSEGKRVREVPPAIETRKGRGSKGNHHFKFYPL